MNDISWTGWAVLALGAFLIGLSKTGIPGVGTLAILVVAYVIPAKASTGLILPMLIVGDIFAVRYYRRHAVWSSLVRLIPAAAAGVILGAWALSKVNDRQLRPIIGGVILVMLAVHAWRTRPGAAEWPIPRGWWFPSLMGILAGITTMMANAAGPIMTIYLLAMRLPKEAFLGTGAWYFLLLNCYKVPFSAGQGLIHPASLRLNLVLLPLIVAGALCGVRLVRILPERTFTAAVQWLALLGALRLLF